MNSVKIPEFAKSTWIYVLGLICVCFVTHDCTKACLKVISPSMFEVKGFLQHSVVVWSICTTVGVPQEAGDGLNLIDGKPNCLRCVGCLTYEIGQLYRNNI